MHDVALGSNAALNASDRPASNKRREYEPITDVVGLCEGLTDLLATTELEKTNERRQVEWFTESSGSQIQSRREGSFY